MPNARGKKPFRVRPFRAKPLRAAPLRAAPLRVGLTGGIGSGKTTVLRFFKEAGAIPLDADASVRKLLKKKAVLRRIQRRFGSEVLDSRGRIDKKRLANRIFNNKLERHSLEAILHPLVRKDLFEKIKKMKGRVAVVDVPLLFESKLSRRFDVVVVVSSSPKMRKSRLLKRGMSPADIKNRMKAQWPLSRKAALADFVINNDGTLSQTRTQVRRLWKKLVNKRGNSNGTGI